MLSIVLAREISIERPLSEALDPELKQFILLFNKLKQKYSGHALLKMLQAERYFIPCSIFNSKLSSLETIAKYLVENEKLTLKKIAQLTDRTSKNIWQAYNSSKKKHPEWFNNSSENKILLPLEIFDKNSSIGAYTSYLTVFEQIVLYLKDNTKLSYHEIALALKRNDRTIWSIYQRAFKKIKTATFI